jgi:hypothetical protein
MSRHHLREVSHATTDSLHTGTLGAAAISASDTSPTVVEVVRFEDLPLGSRGARRAIARWSDGSESEALCWYADEILICEGDHGNSRLMSCRGEMRSVAGSVHASRDS